MSEQYPNERDFLATLGIDYDKLMAELKKTGIPFTRELLVALEVEAAKRAMPGLIIEDWDLDAEADYPDNSPYDV